MSGVYRPSPRRGIDPVYMNDFHGQHLRYSFGPLASQKEVQPKEPAVVDSNEFARDDCSDTSDYGYQIVSEDVPFHFERHDDMLKYLTSAGRYVLTEHSVLGVCFKRTKDSFTRCQRRWLLVWTLLMVTFQAITRFALLHGFGETKDMVELCYSKCTAIDPYGCFFQRVAAIEMDDDDFWAFALATLSLDKQKYFVYDRSQDFVQYDGRNYYQECENFRLCFSGHCTNTACSEGCFDNEDGYFIEDCERNDEENFGLLCRAPSDFSEWKKHLWFWIIIPFFFFVVLYPIRSVLVYHLMPCLNTKNTCFRYFCECILIPQYMLFFTIFVGATLFMYIVCITTHQDYYHTSFAHSFGVVTVYLLLGNVLNFFFEFIALSMDFLCCCRWKENFGEFYNEWEVGHA